MNVDDTASGFLLKSDEEVIVVVERNVEVSVGKKFEEKKDALAVFDMTDPAAVGVSPIFIAGGDV